jgi:hypothetical protein
MATITSAQSGDFSDTTTWVGGVVPTVGDDAVAATGHTVVIDVDTTVDKVTQAGTGKFTLGNGRTLTAEVEANAGTFTSGGTVEVIATTTAAIVGDVTGVSSTAVNVAGVVVTGSGTLTITGNVTGSAGNASSEVNGHAGVYANVVCTVVINGDVTAGSGAHKRAVQFGVSSGAATLTITATTISAGGGGQAYGIFHQGASGVVTATATTITGGTGNFAHGIVHTGATGTVTATATTITGGTGGTAEGIRHTGASGTVTVTAPTIQGSTTASTHGISHTGATGLVTAVGNTFGVGQNSHGISSTSLNAGSGVVLTGDMTDSSLGATAVSTRIFRLAATTSGTTTYANDIGYPTGGFVTRVSPDNVTGMPAEANVRGALTYGFNSELTGSLAVPPAASVGIGVPVDNTVGTAALAPADIAALVGAQIAAAVDSLP